jgi:hypothetical protein
MIDPADFLRVVIDPSLQMLTNVMSRDMGGDPARVLLLAIGLQESNLEHRLQIDDAGQPRKPLENYARGFLQFEKGGGVHGVCTHSATKDAALTACTKLAIPFTDADVHTAIAYNDYLALIFARLLLFTDPKPLPAVGAEQEAYDYYLRVWRPGKPNRERWAKIYPLAVQTVAAANVMPALAFIAPKPGTLTTKKEGGVVQVDLPEMNRSWKTGDFWLAVGSTALYGLVLLAPIVEPAMDRLGSSAWLAALPLGIGPIAYAVARQWYKSQRVKYAAEVATASARSQ